MCWGSFIVEFLLDLRRSWWNNTHDLISSSNYLLAEMGCLHRQRWFPPSIEMGCISQWNNFLHWRRWYVFICGDNFLRWWRWYVFIGGDGLIICGWLHLSWLATVFLCWRRWISLSANTSSQFVSSLLISIQYLVKFYCPH